MILPYLRALSSYGRWSSTRLLLSGKAGMKCVAFILQVCCYPYSTLSFPLISATAGSAAKVEGETTDEQRMEELQTALQRLPRVHLYVLDTIVQHLRTSEIFLDPAFFVANMAT